MVKLENSRETNTGGIFKLGERPRPVERSILNELDERSRVFEKVSRSSSFLFPFFSFFFFSLAVSRPRAEKSTRNSARKTIHARRSTRTGQFETPIYNYTFARYTAIMDKEFDRF